MTVSVYGTKPFGLRQVLVRQMKTSPGAPIAFPVAQTFKVTPESQAGKLEGDDARVALVGFVIGGAIDAAQGGISLEALCEVSGYTLVESGTTPNRTKRVQVTNQPYPYVELWGRSIGDQADDIYVHVYRAKLQKPPEGEFKMGAFYVNTMTFDMICDPLHADEAGNLSPYEIVQRETSAVLSPT